MVMSKLVLEVDRIREMMGLIPEGLYDTSWSNERDETVTLIDLLRSTEHIPVKKILVKELIPHLLSWDGDEEEIEKIEKANLKYPILIFVDDNGKLISIIDGHHRAQKAARHGLKTIKSKEIPINQLPDEIKKVFGHMIGVNEVIEQENELIVVEPSERVIKSICDSAKFCKAQGPITFGQLKAIVEGAKNERLVKHMGEGGFKAVVRLLPWFLPQLALGGFIAAGMRALNKIVRPGLTETTSYKTWWGRTIMRVMDIAEGELSTGDPFSKIFFISDGLMNMMNEENKVKFARHIADLASQKPNDEPVPEFFVDNELRNWVNQRFLLDPPLEPKQTKENERLD